MVSLHLSLLCTEDNDDSLPKRDSAVTITADENLEPMGTARSSTESTPIAGIKVFY